MIIRTVGLFDKVEPTLEQAQSLVGGYVEKITLTREKSILRSPFSFFLKS